MKKSKRIWPEFGDGDDYSNLETWSREDLSNFWVVFRRPGKVLLQMLWPMGNVPPGARGVLSSLAAMAMDLSVAKKARLEGDIRAALVYEGHADLRFAELPKWAQW